MATSPLFGWEEPDDTDLVKDGAAAIRTLGNAIDTSMGDLLGGTTGQVLSKASNTNMDFTWVAQDDSNAIQNAIVDAKGDLIAATAADTPARLAVGTNGQVLTADSAEATGLKWASAAGGSMTVLASGNLATGTTTTTFNSISSSYLNLRLVIRGFNGSGNNTLLMRVNNDSGGNYATYYSGYEANATRSQGSNGNTSWNLTAGPFTGGSYSNFMVYDFADYANTTTRKVVNCQATFYDANGPANAIINATGGYSGTNAAISRIDLIYGSNVNGGTYILYGVN